MSDESIIIKLVILLTYSLHSRESHNVQTFITEIITEIILKLGWLKAIAGFAEDPGSIVSTHISGFTTSYNSSSKGSSVLYWTHMCK